MSLSSSHKDSIALGKLQLTSKAKQEERMIDDDMHPLKNTCKVLSITDLPDDCLTHVYQSLKSSTDRTSFSLVCHRWLYIRFQRLKFLSLSDACPEVTDYVISQSQFFGLQVLFQCINPDYLENPTGEVSLMPSWLPHMTSASPPIISSRIADQGLNVLAECCASLEKVDLSNCQGITDSGICFLIQNCSKLRSLTITDCGSVTGIGFLGCPKTLTHVAAEGMRNKLIARGIKAIVSGGGLQSLYLSGPEVTNKAVITISTSCPLLKILQLKTCHEVQYKGWKAIGLHCRNLKALYVVNCQKLCREGLRALCRGCNNLSYFFSNSCTDFALELFKRERPDVLFLR